MLVPGVGVREGILIDLVAEQYSAGSASEEEKGRAAEMREGTLWFASRLNYNQNHAEQVARLALSLFDQLRPIHEMGADLRLLLEIGALLHDVGHFINRQSPPSTRRISDPQWRYPRFARLAMRNGGCGSCATINFEIRASARALVLCRSGPASTAGRLGC